MQIGQAAAGDLSELWERDRATIERVICVRRIGALVAVLAFISGIANALPAQRFEPLKDTLVRYNILSIPQPSDYPDYPAVAVLSVHEFRQISNTHVRFTHLILKILTAAGKRYTTMSLPCYSECHVEGRTIKADGSIMNVPAKDFFYNAKLTRYNAPFSYVQFAVPGVDPGDIVEIQTSVAAPVPLFMQDFRFSETYPVVKAVLLLSHPTDYSYSYYLQGKPGAIDISKQKKVESGIEFIETQFQMNHVAAGTPEPYSAGTRAEQPGVRFLMIGRAGNVINIFKDWFSYGKFVSEGARLDVLPPKPIVDFVKQATAGKASVEDIVGSVIASADQRILIGSQTLMDSGFDFTAPEQVLQNKSANPHEYALFLAACFRALRWASELVLVNSHELPATSKDKPFPLDLDLVFLNVKTPEREFLIDCNSNGMPLGAISSSAMNRFALIIPVMSASSTMAATPSLSTLPFRQGNTNRLEMTWTPSPDSWNVDLRWFLGGELQSKFLTDFRQENEAEFEKDLAYYLRTHLEMDHLENVRYQWNIGGIEIRAKGRLARTKLDAGCELVQNTMWDTGFNFRQYVFENRVSDFLLPLAGEISSTITINLEPGVTPVIPAPESIEFKPVKYTLTAQKDSGKVVISEKITIADLLIRPAAFAGFTDFLDRYYAEHFWSVLLLSKDRAAAGGS